MKGFIAFILLSLGLLPAFAQNEQSPIVEKDFDYKDWTYKNVRIDANTNLREFSKGKKLVLVVYFAPWCPNWKHDVAFVQGLYDKYKASGLEIIGVGEYDPVPLMKTHLDTYKITFPTVYESDSRASIDKTVHYSQRREAGDTRKWGSPWYVFLDPASLERTGDVLAKKVNVVNGELIKIEAERFIRDRLGMKVDAVKAGVSKNDTLEICEPAGNSALLKNPQP